MANEPFDNASLPDFSTAENLASFISNSEQFLGESDAVVANLQFLDGKYSKTKEKAIQRIYKIIALHSTLKSLADLVTDPQGDGEVTQFLLLCRGPKINAKKRILNACMMFVTQH